MATSGRAGLLALAMMIGGCVACSGSSSPTPTQTASTKVARTLPTPNAYEATLIAQEARAAKTVESLLDITPFCTVEAPESWRTAIEQGKFDVPSDSMGYFYPFAVGADGSQVFGSLHSDQWSGVVAVARAGTVTRIRPFDNPDRDSANGAFDGRWLVWGDRPSEQYLALRDVHVWDRTTGEVMDLPDARDVSLTGPVLSQGKFAWSRSLGNLLQPYELHIYSLADRHDTVVSNGKQVFPIVFLGSKLLLSEQDTPDDKLHLAMVDATTGEFLPPPGLLTSLAPTGNITASGGLMAWPSNDAVTVWHSGEPKASQIYDLDPYAGVPDIGIAGDLVEWGSLKGTVIADLRSGSAVVLGDYRGASNTNGQTLLLSKPVGAVGNNGDDQHYETYVVDVSKLPPLPRCPS